MASTKIGLLMILLKIRQDLAKEKDRRTCHSGAFRSDNREKKHVSGVQQKHVFDFHSLVDLSEKSINISDEKTND
jgi:hypothetical protein